MDTTTKPLKCATHVVRYPRWAWGLLCLILVGLRVALQLAFNNTSQLSATHVTSCDIAAYGTALLKHDNPDLFTRDPLFGHARFADSMWSSSYLYLTVLRWLMRYTEGDWLAAYHLYALVCIPVMFLFVWYASSFLLKEPLPRLAIAFLATLPAGFTVTASTWGVPVSFFRGMEMDYRPTPVIPETIFNVFSPLLAIAIFLATTAFRQKHTLRAAVALVGCGCLAGSSLFWAHSVSAVAFIQLSSFVLLIFALKKQQSLSSLGYFLTGTLGFVLVRMTLAEGVGWELDDVSAHLVMKAGRTSMVFPWGAPHFESVFSAIGLATYISLTLWLLWKFRLDCPSNKMIDVSLIMVQGLYGCVAMRFGIAPLLVAVYYAMRGYRGHLSTVERALFVALCAANVVGLPQQFIFSLLWETGWINPLTGVMYEMARFQNFAVPILLLLVVRAAWQLSENAGPSPLREISFFTLIALCAAMLVALLPLYESLCGVCLLLFGRFLINREQVCTGSATSQQENSQSIFLAAGITILVVGMGFADIAHRRHLSVTSILSILYGQRVLAQTDVQTATYKVNKDFLEEIDRSFIEVTRWANRYTPTDSLFHLVTRDTAFRPLAQRSLLVGHPDASAGVYGGGIVHELARLSKDTDLSQPPEGRLCILNHVGTNYLVTLKEDPVTPCPLKEGVVVAEPVFKNQVFVVYKIAKNTASVSISLP